MTWREIHSQLTKENDAFLERIKGNLELIGLAFGLPDVDGGVVPALDTIQMSLQETSLACEHYAVNGSWPLIQPKVAASCFQRIRLAIDFCEFISMPEKGPVANEPELPEALRAHILKWLLVEYPVFAGMHRQIYQLSSS